MLDEALTLRQASEAAMRVAPALRRFTAGGITLVAALGCLRPTPGRIAGPNRFSSATEIQLSEIRTIIGDANSAEDVIRMLRPAMLIARIPTSSNVHRNDGTSDLPIQVYVDGVLRGGAEFLRTIPARSVINIRRLSSLEAMPRYGAQFTNGIIAITTGAPDQPVR